MIILLIYGEGPHTIAQIFIPLAGLFYLKFLEVKRYSWMILASLSIMLMAISNPIGLWAGGMLLGSIFIIFFLYKANKKEIIFRTFLIFILSYLFAAFWYTPGFIQSDLIAEGGGLAKMLFWHFPWGISLAGLIIGVFLYLIRRFVSSPYIATLVFWFLLTFFVIVAFYKYGIEFAPQARRYVPELDMASVALLAVIASRISKTIHKKTKFADYIIPLFVILTLFFTFKTWSAAKYFTSYDDGANRGNVEKRMNQYLSGKILPLERIFLSANYSFWINMQTDTWHLRGGHWQASIHPWEPHAGYQIISDKDGEASFYWLKIFSLKWILVNNFGSSVYYRDYNYPDKFEGILTEKEETIDSAEVLYKVPLVHEMAGPVDLNKIASLKVPQNGVDKEALKLYVSWIDENSSQFNFKRLNNDRYIIEGITGKNEGIRIAMSFDKGFRAYDENAKRLEIVKDPLGFIVIRPPKPGVNKVTLVYKQTLDFYLGWFLFAGGILLAIFLKVIIKENDGKN
ncbi:MAG: hypothetical protein A2V72_02395 [Candidatus Nealsonbacteria bacterium RBG_13_37_56]|uniref:Membrane protein 6-pyruvoyl-tetrahydropterin synthase-related domain-containing protein n=1 Tax=Candidatus Nealsonbacteria bacterium RBG_13_37_56 TaxID=1801661 RepID=A0A1G2DWP5_9BACT|nr:MAG: hypothetical protein A2V72_02395 [Candidatus Nealsonbacteria bacterium RBG_13_37_56]